MLQPDDPAGFFADPAFFKSMTFKLSSSNVSPGTYYYGGFGAVVPDGYGVNYSISKTGINMSISSWNGHSTDATAFREALIESMNDMYTLFDKP
jgi:carnitine O-acetyltransferase